MSRNPIHPTVPRPVLVIAGETDAIVPFAAQMAATALARQIDGAPATGTPCGPSCTLYASPHGSPFEVITHPGGHLYPEFAAARIVEFFQQQALAR